MSGFGDLLGGLFELLGGGAVEGAAYVAAEAVSDGSGDQPKADTAGTTRYLVGGARALGINDI